MNPIDDIPAAADRALLQAAQAGNEEALGRLVAPYRRGLELFCGLMLGDAKQAERAMVQTMRTASSEVTGIRSPAGIRMWIHRITARTCLQAVGPEPDSGPTIEIGDLTSRMGGWQQSCADAPPSEPDGL